MSSDSGIGKLTARTLRGTAQTASPVGNKVAPLGTRTAGGFVLMLVQVVLLKFVAVAGQLVIAWLLLPESLGIFSLALTITAFAGIAQDAGVTQVLLHRNRRFRIWSTPAFWLCLTAGFFTSVAVLALTPLAAHAYRAPNLMPLLFVLSATPILNALAVVPAARLQAEMRFTALAISGLGMAVFSTALTIVLAYFGCGAYSLAVPIPAVAALRTIVLWTISPVVIQPRLRVRRWRYLLGHSGKIVCAGIFITVTMQADYIILGLMMEKTIVGMYYFGFNLSMQSTSVLAAAISAALFPALSALQREPTRQLAAFRRSATVLAAVGVPLCLLQAGAAEPLVQLMFERKWVASIPIIQILSVGMAVQLLNGAAGSLILAQGRFDEYLRLTGTFALMMPTLVAIGAFFGGVNGVAAGAATAAAVAGFLMPYIALRPTGGRIVDVWKVYFRPFVGGSMAVGTGMLAAQWGTGPGAKLLLTLAGFFTVYLLFILRFVPTASSEVRTVLIRVRQNMGGRRPTRLTV